MLTGELAALNDFLDTVKAYVRMHSVVRWHDADPIVSADGTKFRWMFDLRPLLLDGRMVQVVAGLFWDRLQGLWPFQVAGIELAAVP